MKQTQKPNRAERREIARASKHAEKHGADCCGKPLSRILPALVIRTQVGLKIWHTACPIPPGADCVSLMSAEICKQDPDIDADREWFAAHPGAEFYCRKSHPEEWRRWHLSNAHGALRAGLPPIQLIDCPEEHRYMAVRQLEPGKRARLPWVIRPDTPPPTVERMREQFDRLFNDKSGPGVDPALIAATVAAKAFGHIKHDLLDIAEAEGEALAAVKH